MGTLPIVSSHKVWKKAGVRAFEIVSYFREGEFKTEPQRQRWLKEAIKKAIKTARMERHPYTAGLRIAYGKSTDWLGYIAPHCCNQCRPKVETVMVYIQNELSEINLIDQEKEELK